MINCRGEAWLPLCASIFGQPKCKGSLSKDTLPASSAMEPRSKATVILGARLLNNKKSTYGCSGHPGRRR